MDDSHDQNKGMHTLRALESMEFCVSHWAGRDDSQPVNSMICHVQDGRASFLHQ